MNTRPERAASLLHQRHTCKRIDAAAADAIYGAQVLPAVQVLNTGNPHG